MKHIICLLGIHRYVKPASTYGHAKDGTKFMVYGEKCAYCNKARFRTK